MGILFVFFIIFEYVLILCIEMGVSPEEIIDFIVYHLWRDDGNFRHETRTTYKCPVRRIPKRAIYATRAPDRVVYTSTKPPIVEEPD